MQPANRPLLDDETAESGQFEILGYMRERPESSLYSIASAISNNDARLDNPQETSLQRDPQRLYARHPESVTIAAVTTSRCLRFDSWHGSIVRDRPRIRMKIESTPA